MIDYADTLSSLVLVYYRAYFEVAGIYDLINAKQEVLNGINIQQKITMR